MNFPSFCVVAEPESQQKTLADLPEWVIAECVFEGIESLQRFRIKERAYNIDNENGSPTGQCEAKRYIVKKIIGRIICK